MTITEQLLAEITTARAANPAAPAIHAWTVQVVAGLTATLPDHDPHTLGEAVIHAFGLMGALIDELHFDRGMDFRASVMAALGILGYAGQHLYTHNPATTPARATRTLEQAA